MSTQTIATPPTSSAPHVADPYVLRVEDRCDRCGAQAFVAASFLTPADATSEVPGDRVLLFCAHHAREHDAKITGHIVADNTAALYGHNRQQGEAHA